MRKTILSLVAALVSVAGANAAQGDFSAGVQFSYGSKFQQFGIGAQVQYELVHNLRIATSFNHYFEGEDVTANNLNLNLHYLIPTSSVVTIYPLAGLAWSNFSQKLPTGGSNDYNRVGANIGMGVEYHISSQFTFYTEEQYQILKDCNQSVTNMGLRYRF